MALSHSDQPVPFEIVTGPDGLQVASNGRLRIVVPDAGGKLFRRRGLQGLPLRPPAEQLIPQLNALATELLQRPDMSAHEAVGRLLALAGMVPTAEPRRIEWIVGELNGVRVYADGETVVITTQDMTL
jgi:hypothetical protein